MESMRQQKFGKLIQKDLSEIFHKEYQSLLQVGMITITDVKMSPDLSIAKIYLSFLLVKNPNEMVDLLNEKTKMIRNSLGQKIRHQARIIPHLNFYLDDTSEYAAKIEKLFENLNIPPEEKDSE
jgi:ribosome-binding factor A